MAFLPWRSNNLLALSISDSYTNMNRPYRLTNRRKGSSPSQNPKKYRPSEEATPAAVVHISRRTNEKRPCPTRKLARARVSSVGIGRCRVPNATRMTMPT